MIGSSWFHKLHSTYTFFNLTKWAICSVSLFGKTYNQLIILQFNTTFKRYLSNLESLALRNKQSIELIPFQI